MAERKDAIFNPPVSGDNYIYNVARKFWGMGVLLKKYFSNLN